MRVFLPLILLSTGLSTLTAFPIVESQTLDQADFRFPADALESPHENKPVLFAIAMSATQENGEEQQVQLMDWHQRLQSDSRVPDDLPIYHFAVIESPPFFVRGLIRRGIRRSLQGKVSDDRAAVLFVDSTLEFARTAGIPLDTQATMVVLNPDGSLRGYIKGDLTSQSWEQLLSLLLE